MRGRDNPYRSQGWAKRAQTSTPLKPRSVELFVGGRAPRALAAAVEKALGQFVRSKRASSTLTDPLRQDSEAWRTRALRGLEGASLVIDPVYAPLRRWGSKPGGRWGWGRCVDGRQVFLPPGDGAEREL